jgi:hypothetical protein
MDAQHKHQCPGILIQCVNYTQVDYKMPLLHLYIMYYKQSSIKW